MKSYEELIEDYDEVRFALLMDKMMQYESALLRERYVDVSIQEIEIDPRVDRQCREKIERSFCGKRKMIVAVKAAIKVFVIAAIISSIAITTVCSFSSEFSDDIKRFVAYQYEKFTMVKLEKTQTDDYESPLSGFELIASGEDSYERWFLFSSGESWYDLSFVSCQEEMLYNVDTENAEVRNIKVDSNEGLFIEKDGEYHVVIGDAQNNVIVSAFGHGISEEEIMSIAEDALNDTLNWNEGEIKK